MNAPIVPVRSSYDDVVDAFAWPIPEAFNIGVACSDAQPPADIAVVEFDPAGQHRSYTFGALSDASSRLANALLGLELETGDRVAILLPQSFAAAAAHLGWRVAAVGHALLHQWQSSEVGLCYYTKDRHTQRNAVDH